MELKMLIRIKQIVNKLAKTLLQVKYTFPVLYINLLSVWISNNTFI